MLKHLKTNEADHWFNNKQGNDLKHSKTLCVRTVGRVAAMMARPMRSALPCS